MTGISDQYTTIGVEAVAWGTAAATLTRGMEVRPTKPTYRVEQRPSTGLRPGFLGNPVDTHVTDSTRGGTYQLAFDLLSESHSMALATLGSAPAITTPDGATNTRLHTITPSDHTLRSTTIHDALLLSDGSLDYINYLGGKATQGVFSISPKGNVQVAIDFDWKTRDTAASSVTPAFATSPYVFRDTDVTTSIGGTDVCQRGIDFTIPTGAKIDLDRICPGGRDEPVVAARVEPTGTLSVDFASVDYLDDWIAGTPFELIFTIQGGTAIEGSFYNSCTVTFAEVIYTGDAPERSLTDLTVQSLPWMALDNGTDPIWKIEYQTTDTAA